MGAMQFIGRIRLKIEEKREMHARKTSRLTWSQDCTSLAETSLAMWRCWPIMRSHGQRTTSGHLCRTATKAGSGNTGDQYPADMRPPRAHPEGDRVPDEKTATVQIVSNKSNQFNLSFRSRSSFYKGGVK
jgi:hypothetical protein